MKVLNYNEIQQVSGAGILATELGEVGNFGVNAAKTLGFPTGHAGAFGPGGIFNNLMPITKATDHAGGAFGPGGIFNNLMPTNI